MKTYVLTLKYGWGTTDVRECRREGDRFVHLLNSGWSIHESDKAIATIRVVEPPTRTLRLPCFGIVVNLKGSAGTIKSDLHEDGEPVGFKAAMDAIESIVLAHACAGVNVETPAYIEGIETAVLACSQAYN